MDAESDFFSGLIELFYGENVEHKLRNISKKVKWAKGWPENDVSFWNAESFLWRKKVAEKDRILIIKELGSLKKGKNLDIGCGAFSYLPSVCFDFSEKMLKMNDNCVETVVGSLEKKLPFSNKKFDSVTAIFVMNYIKNYSRVFSEVKRVLNGKGVFVMVLGAKGINDWQKQKEKNDFSKEIWKADLRKSGFKVNAYQKENLLFFVCKKQKDY